eukprot:jgi/Mesen1/10557/ME000843S10068
MSSRSGFILAACLLICYGATGGCSAAGPLMPTSGGAGGIRGLVGLISSKYTLTTIDTAATGGRLHEGREAGPSGGPSGGVGGESTLTSGSGRRPLALVDPSEEQLLFEEGGEGGQISPGEDYYYRCTNGEQEAQHSEGYQPGRRQAGGEKFLAVGRLAEQLTKARRHLAEVVALARHTGRTLILPAAGNAKLASSLDYRRPLCAYLDTRALGRLVDWVTEDFFFDEFERRRRGRPVRDPTIFTLFLHKPHYPCNATYLFMKAGKFSDPQGVAVKPPRSMALVRTGVTGAGRYACSSACPPGRQPHPLALLTSGEASSSEVVVIVKSTPHACLGEAETELAAGHLAYPARLTRAAARLVSARLGARFLAIHWRTEKSLLARVGPASMALCARSLIASALSAQSARNLSGVFLATDISPADVEGGGGSQSYVAVRQDKRRSTADLISGVHLALGTAQWASFDPIVPSLDKGIQGILDKLVCVQAHTFLQPPPYCYGFKNQRMESPSSFTREIVELRTRAGREKDSNQQWPLLAHDQ